MSQLPEQRRLAAEIAGARWYGNKGTPVAKVEPVDELELGEGVGLHILLVTGEDESSDHYLYPVGLGELARPFLEALSEGRQVAGKATWSFEPGGALAGMLPANGRQRPIGIDQTNTSLVAGERLVLKLYRRLEPGPHPEVEMGRYLTDHAHITFMPAFGGAVRWGEYVIAMAQAYVADAEDGWDWGAECVLSGDVEAIALLGQRTRALHNALAGMASSQATASQLHGWRVAADAQLDRALELIEGDVGQELRLYEPRIRRELRALETPEALPLLTPVHGDYHIGQVLRSQDGLRVVDFEGEPTKSLAERSALGTPLRDVAAMLRSFDHLARWVDHEGGDGRPGLTAACERWIREARASFLGAYGAFDARLLRALEVEKETYEFVYSARFLPDWMYAPVGGMRWLMGGRRL